MFSIVFYASLALATTVLASLWQKETNQKKRNLYFIAMVLIPAIFAGLRYYVGTDYGIHEGVFFDVANGLVVEKHAEVGYIFLNKIVSFFNGHYNIVLFIVHLISLTCYFLSIKHFEDHINVPLAVLFYFLLYYQMSLNYIRQLLAASIALYGCVLYLKDKKILGLFVTMLSGLFHMTGLIYLPMMLLYKFFTNDKYNIIKVTLYIAGVILLFTYPLFLPPILEDLEEVYPKLAYFFNYLEHAYKPIGIGLFRYLLLIVIPGVVFYRQSKEQFKFLLHISILGFCLWLTSYVTKLEFYRIGHNFLYVLPILLAYYFKNAPNLFISYEELPKILHNKVINMVYKYRVFLYRFMILFLVIFFWIYDFFILGAHETIPYVWILGVM